MAFAILLMTLHPEIMTKVQKELDEVVGRSRLPSVADRSKYIKIFHVVKSALN